MKILKFGAVWCPGCIVMRPRWQEIEQEIKNLSTQYFDFDKDKDMATKYNISEALPCFVFLDKNEREFLRLTGEVEKSKLIGIIKENFDK